MFKTYKIKIIRCSILIFTLSIFLFGCAPAKKVIPSMHKLEVLAFYEKGWNDLTYGYPSLVKHYDDIDFLIPFWFTVQEDGSLGISKIGYEQKVVDFIRKYPEVKLIPLINNKKDCLAMLTDPKIRTIAIDNIVKKTVDNNYAGVNIDFELLPKENKEDLNAFVKDLSQKLKAKKKLIFISVFPKVNVSEDVSGVYDYEFLAKYTDLITVMTYDNHSDSSGPGSVAPYNWVEKNIKYAADLIPKNKLAVCIGAYGYDWPTKTAEGNIEYLGLKEIMQRAKEKGAKIQWDDQSQSPFFTYNSNGTVHTVWFENGYSAARKIALAKQLGLRGVAIWRIGFEDEEYWTRIKNELAK